MAQSPDKPLDDGRVRMPRVDSAMNKIPKPAVTGGKGSKRDKKSVAMRQSGKGDKQEKDQETLARARKRFLRCIGAEQDNRKNAVDDLKFKSGEGQWPADVVAERNFDKRPTLTINKLPTFVNQVVNDQRMNRPAINISPVGDKSDPEVAKMYRGLIRAIERNSSADIAYDTAFDSAVSMGFGYWRVMLDWEAPDSFDQTVAIRRVRNPFTVYLDPSHQQPDGSDARFGFVTEMVPRKEFEDEYPDADPLPWDQGGVGEDYKQWVTQDEIRVAEYFDVATQKRELVELENGHVGWWDELDERSKKEFEVTDRRWSDCHKVMWYKMTATSILDSREWPGKWVPIVKLVGNEIDIEGKVRLSGLIRNAKGPQLIYNYMRTVGVEITMLQPKAPYIVVEGQIEGYEQDWKQANVKPMPYLQVRPVSIEGKPAPLPQRQQYQGSPATMAEVQAAAADMMAVTGLRFDATPSERVYDESGRALRELRERGDLGSFHYIDNLARSLRHCGEILVDLIPKVYETKRMVTILREDDSEEQVQLDPAAGKPFQRAVNPRTQKILKVYNPTYGRYGVTVTIGPSYASKRIEAAESMMDFVRALGPAAQQIIPLIADLVAKNQDWEGAEQIARRLATLVPPGALAQDMEDVPPQVQALLKSLQQQLQALTNEKQQLIHALTEQQSDRAQRQSKIDNDFEAKLLNIMAQFEAKMAAIQQKAEDSAVDRVMAPILELAEGVKALREILQTPANDTLDEGMDVA